MPADMVIVEFFGVPRLRVGRAEVAIPTGSVRTVLSEIRDRCPGLPDLLTTTASTFGGMLEFRSRGRTSVPVRICFLVCSGVAPQKGGCPVIRAYTRAPSAYWSDISSMNAPGSHCSGEKYATSCVCRP